MKKIRNYNRTERVYFPVINCISDYIISSKFMFESV